MKTQNILATKFTRTSINKQNTLKISKTLLGLLALGVCIKVTCGCYQRSQQQKQEAAEHDRTTMGVLIDKKIIKDNRNKNHVIIWLDTDNNRKTLEGLCNMPDANTEKTLNIASLTNGTTKSLAEWRQIAHPYEVQHNPCDFLPSK